MRPFLVLLAVTVAMGGLGLWAVPSDAPDPGAPPVVASSPNVSDPDPVTGRLEVADVLVKACAGEGGPERAAGRMERVMAHLERPVKGSSMRFDFSWTAAHPGAEELQFAIVPYSSVFDEPLQLIEGSSPLSWQLGAEDVAALPVEFYIFATVGCSVGPLGAAAFVGGQAVDYTATAH